MLQLDPELEIGGLKHGVFSLECVGVASGDICVGVRFGLNTFVGVEAELLLSFLRLIVPLSSPGGGGRDIRDN